MRYTGISAAAATIRAVDTRANRCGAARCARDAKDAAARAVPIEGATAYRLERTGKNIVMANIRTNQTTPNRITRRSTSSSEVPAGVKRNISTAVTVGHVAPRSRYSTAFLRITLGSAVNR